MAPLSSGLSALLAAAAVAGCASMNSPAPAMQAAVARTLAATPACTAPEKQVTINQITVSGSTATIKVDPGSRDIPAAGAGVRWKFSGNNYSFTSDGITFKPNQPSGPGASGFGTDASEFVVCFGNTTSNPTATWQYNVKFYANATPATVWICDPTVTNHGSGFAAEAVLIVNCTRAP